ncbi:glycosyl transferase family 2 [Stella humosa]|uniref:Glycosyl transferase family 2 n=1 Tax=Stella humosa TaxID=94 RepID=A0A3N1LKM2_9PROT|nr:glycosyltransferase family A protein [Stella humosa]ROP90976.1 glycosyl transferase family 2 [Stella humosa]BBK34674.1 hypothetical protein STHU_53080 [Stella humosa]
MTAALVPAVSPVVSIVIPIYNGATHLPGAIEMIEAEGLGGVEIVVVDDGSTDATPDLCEGLAAAGRIITTRTVNRGPGAARNTGVGLAHAPIIGFLDVDDRWPDGRLDWMLRYMVDRPAVEGVMGQIQYAYTSPEAVIAWAPVGQPEGAFFAPHLGAALFRRSLWDRMGGFAEELRYGEDVDWYFRVLESEPALHVLRRLVLLYRMHDGNMTRDRVTLRQAFVTCISRSLARRKRRSNPPARLPGLEEFIVEVDSSA